MFDVAIPVLPHPVFATGVSDQSVHGPLFGHLPADLFRLFGGPARWFYAELLEYLEAELFVAAGSAAPQKDTIAAIAEFIDRRGRSVEIEADAGEGASPGGSSEQRASVAFRRLLQTGWFVEHRDRYRRLVDFDGYARLVLQLLSDIRQGRARSYGGEVLQILTLLESARRNSTERSESIRAAARSARSFMHHLRSVASTMRRVEQELAAHTEVTALFRSFFDGFVQEHLVEDYKRLHTQSNPFRFRVRIIEEAEEILGDILLLDSLADAYVREGRAADRLRGRDVIADELRQVIMAFQVLDDHLDTIEDINRRIERRVRNTVRHMDRILDVDIGILIEALGAVGRSRSGIVDTPGVKLLPVAGLLGPRHLFQMPRRKLPPERTEIRRVPPDPAYVAYRDALTEYRGRFVVTSIRMRDYLERALGGRNEVGAEDLPLETLDDFACFERVRGVHWIENGALMGEYAVEVLPTQQFQSEWITCPAFRVRRLTGKES